MIVETGTQTRDWYLPARCGPCALNLLMESVRCDLSEGYHRAFCPGCGEALYVPQAWKVS